MRQFWDYCQRPPSSRHSPRVVVAARNTNLLTLSPLPEAAIYEHGAAYYWSTLCSRLVGDETARLTS